MLPSERGAVKKGVLARRPAAAAAAEVTISPSFGEVKMCLYTYKSYILKRITETDAKKAWTLLIEVRGAVCAQHQEALKVLWEAVKSKDGLDKPALIKLREDAIAQVSASKYSHAELVTGIKKGSNIHLKNCK